MENQKVYGRLYLKIIKQYARTLINQKKYKEHAFWFVHSLMPGSHQAAWLYFAPTWLFVCTVWKVKTIRYIAVIKGVVRCRTVREIGHYMIIHDVSILTKQIKARHFFAHRQKWRDIASMPTAARCELGIRNL